MNEATDEATTNTSSIPSNETGTNAEARFECDPVRLSVALLANAEIDRMTTAELTDVIRLANLPPLDTEKLQQLERLEQRDLRHMAYRTRHACRNRVNVIYEQYEHPPVFRVFEEEP